jgi:hypothetical protein
MEQPTREMRAEQVVELLGLLENVGIEVWLDGGWGVDALLGEQTRPHGDLDIVLREAHLSRMLGALADAGFAPKAGGEAWNFVLADGSGREIDVHVVRFDEQGNGLYGPPQMGKAPYPAEAFSGSGFICDKAVRCLTAEYQVESHTGYELDEDDFRDVSALNRRFGVPIPPDYWEWLAARDTAYHLRG